MRGFLFGASIGFVITVLVRLSGRGLVFGELTLDRATLEQLRQDGRRIRWTAVGMVTVPDDVPVELLDETVERLVVIGLARLSKPAHEALSGRVFVVGTVDAR
jgi:hypothetical protein